uniref:Uncharacterized protein n=1 Tax=Theropithecus gelada TaxID=9565 RepID=A0A8D2FKL9_THEGE
MPLHSSLEDRMRTCLKKKKKNSVGTRGRNGEVSCHLQSQAVVYLLISCFFHVIWDSFFPQDSISKNIYIYFKI